MVFRSRARAFPSLLAALLLSAAAPTPTIAKQRQAQEADAGWLIYRNERYAFRLSYPSDGRVDTRRAQGVQQISIAGAVADQEDATQTAHFQIDVLIYDHRLGHKLKMACRELLQDTYTVKVGKIQGLRGVHPAGEDQTGAGPAVCVESKRLDIVVKTVDAGPEAVVANRILDSLRFGE